MVRAIAACAFFVIVVPAGSVQSDVSGRASVAVETRAGSCRLTAFRPLKFAVANMAAFASLTPYGRRQRSRELAVTMISGQDGTASCPFEQNKSQDE